MKEITLVNEVKKILSATEQRKLRYVSDLGWLDTRQKSWETDRIRVGVVGVTSSGKSTLINALLGDDLLSVAVRPSSSQLVSCSYAKERSAIVYFLNGDKEYIGDNGRLKDKIIEYSDEKYNEKNRKQVAQLELSTPNFALDEDVLLVDSPGLDATGYEAHEKLTLEILLPTVDIVIYVTTVKSEVDKKMKQTMDTIAKYNCPLMVVQNMLDAVRPSVDGKKSAATVAKERMNRVLLAVEQSNIKNKNEVKVTQISAVNAMKYRCNTNPTEDDKKAYRLSRYDSFIDGVKELIQTNRPEIERQRIDAILKHIEELIRQENKRTENIPTSIFADNSLETISVEVTSALDDTFEDIQSVITELQKMYSKYFLTKDDNKKKATTFIDFTSLPFFNTKKEALGEEEIIEIKKVAKMFETRVVESINSFLSKCSYSIKKLNLPIRDLWSYNGLPRMPEVAVKTKTVQRSRTVEKEGLWNGFMRLIGFGGTETMYYTETVTDDEATRESVKRYIERLQFEYCKTLDSWHKNAKATVASIQQEIEIRMTAIKEKEKQALDAEDWKQIRETLEKYISQYGGDLSESKKTPVAIMKNKSQMVQDNTKMIKMPNRIIKIYDAAEKYIHAVQKSSLNFAIQVKKRENRPTVVISNSPDNLTDFLYRFYSIKKKDITSGNIYSVSNEFWIVCSPNETQLKSILKANYGYNVFLLINGLQFHTGFEVALRRRIKEMLSSMDALFMVVQDFEVIANGNAITECIRSVLMEQSVKVVGENGMALISHKNPVYNMAVIHAQISDTKIKEETAFYNSLTAKFSFLVDEVTKKRINNILRSQSS